MRKGKSKIDSLNKFGTQDEDNQNKMHHNVCWTALYANTQIKEIKYEPSYKQLEVKTNQIVF